MKKNLREVMSFVMLLKSYSNVVIVDIVHQFQGLVTRGNQHLCTAYSTDDNSCIVNTPPKKLFLFPTVI